MHKHKIEATGFIPQINQWVFALRFYKIIVPTRVIGRAKLYTLNLENPKVKKLVEIDDMLILEDLKKRSAKQKVKVAARVCC